MRGNDVGIDSLFSYVSCEARVPASHPIRAIVDEVPEVLSADFEGMYAKVGRPSIPPEKLLRTAVVGQVRGRDLLSDEHFPVDGTLIDAWASMKRFRPKDGEAALALVDGLKTKGRITLGADKGYDAREFVRDLRARKVTPHIARHPGYAISLRIEEVFGWVKTTGGLTAPGLRLKSAETGKNGRKSGP